MRPSKENWQFMLKRAELPKGFQGRVFKDSVRDIITYMWNLVKMMQKDLFQKQKKTLSFQNGSYVTIGETTGVRKELGGWE